MIRGSSIEVTYINPHAFRGLHVSAFVPIPALGGTLLPLARRIRTLPSLELELRCNERQHVLAALKESLAGDIVDAGLRLVEALECILLGAALVATVRLQKARVGKQQERLDEVRRRGIVLLVVPANTRELGETDGGEKSKSYSSIYELVVVRIVGQKVTTKRSHGILSFQLVRASIVASFAAGLQCKSSTQNDERKVSDTDQRRLRVEPDEDDR